MEVPIGPGDGAPSGIEPDKVRRKPRRATRPGTETAVILGSTSDDEDPSHQATGAEKVGPNDERLKRDVPPHW